jgi:acetyl esterase/lipase
MDYEQLIDPEIAAVLEGLESRDSLGIAERRAGVDRMAEAVRSEQPSPTVDRRDYLAPGEPDVRVRLYRPAGSTQVLPCLYWIHGGGYISGALELDDRLCESIVDNVGCAVVSVDWRLSPENPYPAAADDCYAGLRWTVRNAGPLDLDTGRVVVGGSSSGGGSAAGLALLVRDRGEFAVRAQLLVHPMLDDRPGASALRPVTHTKVWNTPANEVGWRSYLGAAYGTDDIPAYAAPARATDLAGLPPAFICVGDLDLFLDEDLAYAARLIHAGVPVELHVYPGAPHGFMFIAPGARVSRQMAADRDAALRRFFTA